MGKKCIDPSTYARENILDTRDLEERIGELEGTAPEDLADGEAGELKDLIDARDNITEWRYGETLVADEYFVKHAKQLAKDMGAISGRETWPLTCIDWDEAADELKADYFEVEICGSTFWVRG